MPLDTNRTQFIEKVDHLPPDGGSIKLVFDRKGAKSIERETPTVSFDYTHKFANLDLESGKIDLNTKEIDDDEATEDVK